MINSPETKWPAQSREGSYYTNPNLIITRNMIAYWRNKNTSQGFRPKYFSRTVLCIDTVNLLLIVTLGEKLWQSFHVVTELW